MSKDYVLIILQEYSIVRYLTILIMNIELLVYTLFDKVQCTNFIESFDLQFVSQLDMELLDIESS